MCVSLRETRREYVHVASSSTSLSPTVSRRDTHILPPPQARRPASKTTEASTHLLGLASWKGLARGGTVGDMDVDDKPPWMGSRRVPTLARPFRGPPPASAQPRLPPPLQAGRAPAFHAGPPPPTRRTPLPPTHPHRD